MNQKISMTPHIGAATKEAQKRIGIELAEQIINIYNFKMLDKFKKRWGISSNFQILKIFVVWNYWVNSCLDF